MKIKLYPHRIGDLRVCSYTSLVGRQARHNENHTDHLSERGTVASTQTERGSGTVASWSLVSHAWPTVAVAMSHCIHR